MAESGSRKFDVATDGSDYTELLCEALLAPTADALIGGAPFKTSPVYSVKFSEQTAFFDESALTIEFLAQKQKIGENGEAAVLYNAAVTLVREARAGEWVPLVEANNDDKDEDDDDLDDEERWTVAVMVDEDGNVVNEEDMRYVQEVWDYYFEDDEYTTRRDVRYEYFNGASEPLSIVGQTAINTSEKMLVEDPEVDTALQIEDAGFSHVLTQYDIDMVEAICRRDFNAIKAMLEKIGCFDYPDHYDLEEGDLLLIADDTDTEDE